MISPPTSRESRDPAWARLLDTLLDAAVVSFAVWTVLYEVGLSGRPGPWTLTVVWLPVALVATALVVARSLKEARRPGDQEPPDETGRRARPGGRRSGLTVTALAAVAVAAVLALVDDRGLFWPMWGAATGGCLLLLAQLRGREAALPASPPARAWEHGWALAVSLGLAALSLFILHADADDVYYVNRSTWVAQHGSIPLRDTMYGPLTHPQPYDGGLPVASYETLVGGLAHLLHLPAAGVTYLGVPPLAAFLAGWATWRLCRAWAPRRAALTLTAAVAFVLVSGAGIIGDFSLPRMWQGKVVAVCVIVPLAWLFLTRQAVRPSAWNLFLLAMAGVAFTGLTSTAIILVPVMAGAAVLAGFLAGRAVAALRGAAALAAFPVGMGLLVKFGPAPVGGQTEADPSPDVFVRVLGHRPVLAALAVVALACAPVLARRGAARAMAGAAGAASLLVLVPGGMPLLDAVTGSGPIAWRLMLVAPIAVLVGLLAAVPAPRRLAGGLPGRAAWLVPAAVCAALAVVLATAGRPVWEERRTMLTSRPVWKIEPRILAEVGEAVRMSHGESPVLMPAAHMQALAITTTRVFGVSARGKYTRTLDVPDQERLDRLYLQRVASAKHGPFRPRLVAAAAERLQVSTACFWSTNEVPIRSLERAGYGVRRLDGRLVCLRKSR